MSTYFDYAATTPLRKEVLESMMPYLTTEYGNPSSQYDLGYRAMTAIDEARQTIAKTINAEPDEIFFTSGGSESNSLAIKGYFENYYGQTIITTPIEHHSLLNACGDLALFRDAQVLYVNIDQHGYVDVGNLRELVAEQDKMPLVSIMSINNELGTIEPIKAIGDECRKKAIFHTDAVQAYGHTQINVKESGIDMLSASGHKIYGPKGVGFLYVKKDIQKNLHPIINGGQQEHGIRGGTENVASIVGLAKAAELSISEMDRANQKNARLRDILARFVISSGGWINSPEGKHSSPSHLNFRYVGIRAELWNEFLGSYGICISSGSACNSMSGEPSHVLKAVGLSDEEADESIRVSFGKDTTEEDINELISAMKTGIEVLTPTEEESTDEQYNRVILGRV